MGPYRPDWLEKPSSEDLSAYYPDHASRMGIAGQATINCKVMGDGRLTACVVKAETPKGEHFGDAALALATKFRMIPPDDPSKPTGEVTVPLIFAGPPHAAPPQASRPITPPTPAEAREIAMIGAGVAAAAAVLLVVMIVVLGRYHDRAARLSAERQPPERRPVGTP